MLYTRVTDRGNNPAILIQRDQLDNGFTVTPARPNFVVVQPRSSDSGYKILATTYVSIASSAARIVNEVPTAPKKGPGEYRYFGPDLRARRTRGGAEIEVELSGVRLVLSSLQLLAMSDRPRYVITEAFTAAGLPALAHL